MRLAAADTPLQDQPKGAGEKAIKLQYKKNDGSAGHMAVWTPT